MSLYQYAAVVDGWNAAHDPDGGKPLAPAPEEFERLKAFHGF